MKTMIAARMHEDGGPMVLDTIPVPEVRPTDVLVAVKACGMVPNLGNVLAHWKGWFPHLPLPELPAIFGLDPAGVVEEVGSQVQEISPGDRVYVNPGRSCGSCRNCLGGEMINCPNYTFQGYFGFGPKAQRNYDAYPYGGFSEYVTAPQYALVKLPPNVSFEQAARFGYLGTAYAALRKAQIGPGQTMLVNGISGTLGLGAALHGLALGASRIFGTGRDAALLGRVKALAPSRIEVLPIGERPIGAWAKQLTGGWGVDSVIDALGPGAPASTMLDAFQALRRGGRAIDIGGMSETLPLNVHWLMDNQIQLIGSNWFTPRQGQDMADMAEAGILDLSVFEHHRYPLAEINEAISGLPDRNGGFSNFVIIP
ncbi:MAG: alcohol dehydrogenase catalytic domain-containing protein [Rhodospirillales bacterium]|nr:alcohol dehydrogenase catalytic domain-containing protein [Rhodospirillales bacterium]MDP6645884.1 alcohol dehydrogenase catalytic domain-containing protein [Rhodospirillales bacterium]